MTATASKSARRARPATSRTARREQRSVFERTLLELLPPQGAWSVEDYLWLTDHSTRLVEFTDGHIEVLPVPTRKHQAILKYLFRLFDALMEQIGGTVFFAPLRLQISSNKFREPDLLLLLSENDPRGQERYWLGADLVIEVVSPDKPERDLVEKRSDYAEAGIPEYWIVNPLTEQITVLRLEDTKYVEHGVFARGTQATSALLPDLAVDVGATLDAK